MECPHQLPVVAGQKQGRSQTQEHPLIKPHVELQCQCFARRKLTQQIRPPQSDRDKLTCFGLLS